MHFVVGTGWFDETGASDVRLYHVDGTLVHTFEGHVGEVLAVVVTRDGQHIISGSSDELFKVWSVATKSLVSTCEGHGGTVQRAGGDARRPAHPQRRGRPTVRVWLLDGTLKNTFKLHNHHVLAIVALPDNQHALSGGTTTVKLFNVNDGTVLRTFRHHLGWREVNSGAAARRPPLRQRLGRPHRPHRRARPRAAVKLCASFTPRSSQQRVRCESRVCCNRAPSVLLFGATPMPKGGGARLATACKGGDASAALELIECNTDEKTEQLAMPTQCGPPSKHRTLTALWSDGIWRQRRVG